MHGSLLAAKALAPKCDVHQVESTSGRSALHKAAFWGHNEMTKFLVNECKLNVNAQDNSGDTALHDAAKFGHETIAQILLDAGANATLKNKAGKDASAVAHEHEKPSIVDLIKAHSKK